MQEDLDREQPSPMPAPAKPKKNKLWKWLIVASIVVLLAVIGALAWQLWLYMDDKSKLQDENNSLQSQIDSLKQQLNEATAAGAAENQNGASACDGTVAASLKENISAAVTSKNYAALESYMASNVNVVLAASEKGGPVTPAQAVTDLGYLNNATAPWDFNLSVMILGEFEDGDYSQYFGGNAYVGRSSDDYVVSFKFDNCGKINTIFMTPNTDLL